MIVFKIKRDSWHYKIAGWMGGFYGETDICTYIRMFCVNLVIMTAIAVACMFVLGPPVFAIINVIGLVFGMPWYDFSNAGLTMLGVIAFAGLVLVGCFLQKKYGSNKTAEPGFATLAYRKFKDKTCAKIVLE